MNIILYKNTSATNTINKTLENEKEYQITIKETTNIKTPIIKICTKDNIFNYNYCYIPIFNRYYFIENIDVTPNNIFRLYLTEDVLETYKDSIISSYALIKKATKYNNMYDGGDYNTLITKTNTKYNSNITLPNTNSMILITIGGVK